ncbi:MAG: ketopantoate reductase family protein [Ruminococcaceae bacterium]|nr:ketopantoate reductase family protein [Oscillospiraceae bacterium]
MKPIKTVGIIGLGALGVLYAQLLTKGHGRENTLVLADKDRISRYQSQHFTFNGETCDFHYADAAEVTEPVDLLLFAVKFGGLPGAIETCRHLVGPETTLIAVLNGVASEPMLAEAFSPKQVVWCVAQKMSAVKKNTDVWVEPYGDLALGVPVGADDAHLRRLTAFFESVNFPYSLPADIRTHMWGKLLCNTGCNQTAMVYECGYGLLHQNGPARDTMQGAMREVVAVANAEGIPLSEEDVRSWTAIIDTLPADGEPSMRQDARAHRKSEVELFAGTIRTLAQKHGISVPVNDWLYAQVQKMESAY